MYSSCKRTDCFANYVVEKNQTTGYCSALKNRYRKDTMCPFYKNYKDVDVDEISRILNAKR